MANQFQVADVLGKFNQGRQVTQNQLAQAQQFQQQAAQEQRRVQQFEQGNQQFANQQQLAPIQLQQAQANLLGAQQKNSKQEELIKLEKNIISAQELESIPSGNKAEFLRLKIAKGEFEGRDMTESKKILPLIEAGREQEVSQGAAQLFEVGRQLGIVKAPAQVQDGSFTLGAGQKR